LYWARAGLNPKASPHTHRHSFATHLLDNWADIRYVPELLGHRSLPTRLVYTHVSGQRVRTAYLDAHSPPSRARWEGAVNKVVEGELLEPLGLQGVVYGLTHTGYSVAEELQRS
jgi:Phage integrase family